MQTTFMTPQCLSLAIRKSAALIRNKSPIRVAALAQSIPLAGRWNTVRFNWSDEPERIEAFSPTRHATCKPTTTSVYEVFSGDIKVGIVVAANSKAALVNAIKATTRNTASKLDSDSCGYDNLTLRIL